MIAPLKMLFCFCLLVGCVAFAAEPDPLIDANPFEVQEFKLNDQFKKPHDQTFPKNKVSIFALADRKGSKQLEDWIAPFYERYTDQVDICGIANLKGVPGFMKPVLRKLFRKGVDYPVMMDWSGEVCEAFSYQPGVADIFILTKGGVLSYRTSGAVSEEKLTACYVIVDRLLKEQEAEESASTESRDAPRPAPPLQSPESTTGAPGRAT